MDKQPISLYSSGFNLIKCKFDYEDALTNFCNFAEEIVLSINTSKDNTLEAVLQWKKDNSANHLRILETNISYQHPWWDGMIKNNSLQNCSNEWCVHCDLDERVIIKDKDRWIHYFNELAKTKIKAHLVPSIEVVGDMNTIRWEKEKHISFKWSLHFKKDSYRSPVKEARLANGCINVKLSDSCELTDKDGKLVEATFLLPKELAEKPNLKDYIKFLQERGIFTYHLGYLSLENRILRNREFWEAAWAVEAGKPVEIPLYETQLFSPNLVQIDLPNYK